MASVQMEHPPSASGAVRLMPGASVGVDWANPLTRGLVDLWAGVQLASQVRRDQAFSNAGGATIENRSGLIWRMNNQPLTQYGDNAPEDFGRTDPFTVSFVAGWSALGAYDVILNHSAADATKRGWYVYKGTTDLLRVEMTGDDSVNDRITCVFAPAITAGVLYRFVVTYNGSGLNSGFAAWADGVRLGVSSSFGALTASTLTTNYLRIGYRDVDGMAHNGWVRDIAIWRRQLSPDEVGRFFLDPGQLLLRDPAPVWYLPPVGSVSTTPLAPMRRFVQGDALQLSAGLG